MFLIPDSIACALAYGEGPDADKTHEELVKLVEEGKSPMHEFVKKMNEDPEEDDELFEDDGLSDDDDIYLDE